MPLRRFIIFILFLEFILISTASAKLICCCKVEGVRVCYRGPYYDTKPSEKACICPKPGYKNKDHSRPEDWIGGGHWFCESEQYEHGNPPTYSVCQSIPLSKPLPQSTSTPPAPLIR